MKKLVKILAALTVAVAALAFVGCANGAISPDGTVSAAPSGGNGSGGGTTTSRPAVGTYNVSSVTTSEGTLTPTSDGWSDFIETIGDMGTITVTADGITLMGVEFTWAEVEAAGDPGYTVSGNNITYEDDTFGTVVFTKA